MTAPRYIEDGQTCFVTVEAVGRAFRFVPTVQVRQSIDFIFAWLVTEYGLLVHEFLWMSDHFHMAVTAPNGQLSDFLRDFDSLLSRQLNALRGRSGSNFEKHPGIQIIVDGAGIVAKAIYTLANPLKAGLVARMRQWKGSSSYALEYGRTVTVARPTCGLWAPAGQRPPRPPGEHDAPRRLARRGRSRAPDEASLTLVRPPSAMPRLTDEALRRHIRDEVTKKEAEYATERKAKGRRVIGWREVVTQHYDTRARSKRVLFARKPRVTGTDATKCARVGAMLDRFVVAYREALQIFRTGGRPEFPHGTFLMRVRYGVPCSADPP